jgi:hypothetical protein
MINIYEVTYILVCGDDGLISHTIKNIKEVIPRREEEEEEEEDGNGNQTTCTIL